ncbi:dTMP kinase [Corynebacterium doosanense]|uniref:Thymidylate kinase n=1 Tax=Corynebacterium doosanense CAU 212 = DSM 45436 TaxID=558173 RepID=A0A097IE83_9CORY|nr:dTMP kinase [Corynebacterium doosanense]AIT60446.1 thymidylate kinase [Corynebacterium doosanense CAU 212 = DSM 45436]
MIIAVEGIDGAGKNTLVTAVRKETGADVLAFPRYDDSVHASLAADALHGKMGDLTDSAYGMATLFALDRAGAVDKLRRFRDSRDVLILDRYVASNAAYSWARTRDEGIVDWVAELEFGRLGLPEPDLQVLLSTDPDEAAERARRREAADASRARDAYERDGGLQQRTFDAYVELAQRSWHSPWVMTDDSAEILARIRTL